LQKSYIDILSTIIENSNSNYQKESFNSSIMAIDSWLNNNRETIFEVSYKDIMTEFLILKNCRNNSFSKKVAINGCHRFYTNVILSIKNTISQKISELKKAILFLILSLIIFIFVIFKLIQGYIKAVIEKNTIYDVESRLYSYYYCIDVMKKLCSQSDRSHRPISAIFIKLQSVNKRYSPEDKRRVLERVGEYLTSTIRLSDVACRYGSNSFLILLPNIPTKKDIIPVNRINEGLSQHIKEISPDFKVVVSSSTRVFEEECQEFIQRATKL